MMSHLGTLRRSPRPGTSLEALRYPHKVHLKVFVRWHEDALEVGLNVPTRDVWYKDSIQ
jgi:hypothetical protein